MFDIIFVIPAFNEEGNIAHIVSQIDQQMAQQDISYAVLFVDDGSTDRTSQRIMEQIGENRPIHLHRLARNFGKEIALHAGLVLAAKQSARYFITMDSDGQHSISDAVRMVELAKADNLDIVFGAKPDRQHQSLPSRIASRAFYQLNNQFRSNEIIDAVGDFNLYSHKAVANLIQYSSHDMIYKNIYPALGLKSAFMTTNIPDRVSGESKFSLRRKLSMSFALLFSDSFRLAKYMFAVSLLIFLLSTLYLIDILIQFVFFKETGNGIPSLLAISLAHISFTAIMFSIVLFMISTIKEQVIHKPIYTVDESHGVFGDHR